MSASRTRRRRTGAQSALHVANGRPYRLEHQAGFVIRKVHQRASEIFAQVMAGFDVTPAQFSTLVKLHEEGELSQNHLGRLVATDPATTLGVVKRLRERGLVETRRDPDDGRRVLLRLNRRGHRLVERMVHQAGEVTRQTLAPLDRAERRTLMGLLNRLD
ncbi:MAG: MarR family winged helix-turn-helix transcriptional regulator [Gammaproteobacteria bacterium]